MKRPIFGKITAGILILLLLSSCVAENGIPGASSVPPAASSSMPEGEFAPSSSSPSTVFPSASSQLPMASSVPEKPEVLYTEGEVQTYLQKNLPEMRTSTLWREVEMGLRTAIFGLNAEEAMRQTPKAATWSAFRSLLDGSAEVIFTTKLSADQQNEAKDKGVSLEQIPIAREGIVFTVHADNPVESLTQQQIKEIYSGQITNWAEVGGNDAPIVAYQRDKQSASHRFLMEFMGKTPLMAAPTVNQSDVLFGLNPILAANDYGENAIGYATYLYDTAQYGEEASIKYIQIDEVTPSKNTMADGTYPLTMPVYAVFRADEPENGKVRTLVEWATSYNGQLALAEVGMVTDKNIGYEYELPTIPLYSGTGTGAPITEKRSMIYTADVKYSTKTLENGITVQQINCLTDLRLQQEINAHIVTRAQALSEQLEEYWAYVRPMYRTHTGTYVGYASDADAFRMKIQAINGYLCVTMGLVYEKMEPEGPSPYYYCAETALWDLDSGDRLRLDEWFEEGTDIDQVLNTQVAENLHAIQMGVEIPDGTQKDFMGLPAQGWSLDMEKMYFSTDTPYFEGGAELALSLDAYVVWGRPRDMTDYFIEGIQVTRRVRSESKGTWEAVHPETEVTEYAPSGLSIRWLPESEYATATVINGKVNRFMMSSYSLQALKNKFTPAGTGRTIESMRRLNVSNQIIGEKYVLYHFEVEITYRDPKVPDGTLSAWSADVPIYDLDTGMQVKWTSLFKKDWREIMVNSEVYDTVFDVKKADLNEYVMVQISSYNEVRVTLRHKETGAYYQIKTSIDHLKL